LDGASTSTALTVVAPLSISELQAGSMKTLDMLRKAKNGDALIAEVNALANSITPDKQDPLLACGQKARDGLSAIADQMIGDKRLGEAGVVGKLFSELSDLGEELKIEEVTAPKTWTVRFLTSLPFGLGKRFEPVVAFAERYKKVKPTIDQKQLTIQKLETERVVSKAQLQELGKSALDLFRQLEVAIAAGEVALVRELRQFEADRQAVNSQDFVAIQELRNRRLGLTNLDNRLLRLQNNRADAMLNMPVIERAINNDEQLRATLEDLRTTTIPQIRTGVAIALKIHNQREAAALAGGVQELNAAIRQANVAALGAAQEETHRAATAAANDTKEIIKCMENFKTVLTRGNELLVANAQINQEARKNLAAAAQQFETDLKDTLKAGVSA
jgi:uncharacterized protein YaaN involved in tellurite resistance